MHIALRIGHRRPKRRLRACYDEPEAAIRRGAGQVGRRGSSNAGWMRMIMADHRQTASARVPVRGEQDRRVQFEMPGRIGRDIGSRHDCLYLASAAQQQPAHLILLRRSEFDDPVQ